MRTLCFLSILLMLAVPISAQLRVPTAYQLADYCPWFGRIDPTRNSIVPNSQIPASTPIFMYEISEWTTWTDWEIPSISWDQPESGPIQTEIVFIGQTGDEWGRFGYTISGYDVLLSESATDRQFGSNLVTIGPAPLTMEFFVEDRSGARYSTDTATYYHGELQPISSVHDPWPYYSFDARTAYHVFAIELPAADSEASTSLFVFGVNAFDQNNPPVPEPGTYGVVAAAALLILIAMRRNRAARLVAST